MTPSSANRSTSLRDRPSTLYNFYQDGFGINVVETDEHVSVALANELESGQLGVAVGAPLLEIRRIAYSYHRSAVELRISRLNTEPVCAPVNASRAASQPSAHDSGSSWVATPSM